MYKFSFAAYMKRYLLENTWMRRSLEKATKQFIANPETCYRNSLGKVSSITVGTNTFLFTRTSDEEVIIH